MRWPTLFRYGPFHKAVNKCLTIKSKRGLTNSSVRRITPAI
jgi:hypothetical protein